MMITALREFLRLPDCVIFVGSGVSIWSGLPSWTRLLGDLATQLEAEGQSADLVRREILNGDLLQAASYGVSKMTPASFGSFIRRSVQLGTVAPSAIHKAIVELGPTSFITTNYDALIEQALALWRADTFFPPAVTNRHLVELAEILSARSSHFIFKPHGDANDSSSIILTREQYRLLLPGGERHHAFEALKTLLVTRPVLYLGFGLRDPDFVHLRDLLSNIYQGAVRDHHALMPDVSSDEADYWRSQYGIKLHGYATHAKSDGSRDHRELLIMLQALAALDKAKLALTVNDTAPTGPSQAERVLALTRYTSGLLRRTAPTRDAIEVRVSEVRKLGNFGMWKRFEGWTATRFLTEGPRSAYLVGLPGSGKSFALRTAVQQLASRLQQACMDDSLTADCPALPALIDLKLYKGDLRAQLNAQLPAGFTLQQLRGSLRLKLFLDAFNEMPSEHLDAGVLFTCLNALEADIGPFDVAITSRTSDRLVTRSEDNTFYEIDRFDPDHVDAVLSAQGIKLQGILAEQIRYLLSRPFFLRLVAERLIEIPNNASPNDIYGSFIAKLQARFSERFSCAIELRQLFGKVAYRAIEAESEAFPLVWLTDVLSAQMPSDATFPAADLVNWLVGDQVLISYSGRRASFVHQSITEYCAASELARRLQAGMTTVRDIVASKKWDQCLLLALSLMGDALYEQSINEIIATDLQFAINAVRFAEEGQSGAVSRVLQAISECDANETGWPFYWLSNLPVGPEHTSLLRTIVTRLNSSGGEAVKMLVQVEGSSCKPELLDLLEAHADNFNFSVNGLTPALKPMLDTADLRRLLHIAEVWRAKNDKKSCDAIGDLLAVYRPEDLLSVINTPLETMPSQLACLIQRHGRASVAGVV